MPDKMSARSESNLFLFSDGIPEGNFRKSLFWKKSADDKKSKKNYPVGKELRLYNCKLVSSMASVAHDI